MARKFYALSYNEKDKGQLWKVKKTDKGIKRRLIFGYVGG